MKEKKLEQKAIYDTTGWLELIIQSAGVYYSKS